MTLWFNTQVFKERNLIFKDFQSSQKFKDFHPRYTVIPTSKVILPKSVIKFTRHTSGSENNHLKKKTKPKMASGLYFYQYLCSCKHFKFINDTQVIKITDLHYLDLQEKGKKITLLYAGKQSLESVITLHVKVSELWASSMHNAAIKEPEIRKVKKLKTKNRKKEKRKEIIWTVTKTEDRLKLYRLKVIWNPCSAPSQEQHHIAIKSTKKKQTKESTYKHEMVKKIYCAEFK